MGNQPSNNMITHKNNAKKQHKHSLTKSHIEFFLEQSYQKVQISFTENELILFKLKLKDSENYFFTKFNFMFIFNSLVFQENITTLYNNFNKTIELFSRNNSTYLPFIPFHFLILFENEFKTFKNNKKISYENLFTIIFEKFEIYLILYLDFTNNHPILVKEFIVQLCENAFLYKCNRQFGCLYCLLPNTDYVIKNSNSLTYITSHKQKDNKSKQRTPFATYFNVRHIKKLVNAVYEQTQGIETFMFEEFMNKALPSFAETLVNINFNCKVENFFILNENQLKLFEVIIRVCKRKTFLIYLNKDFVFNENFEIFIHKILYGFLKICNLNENAIKLKFMLFNYAHIKRPYEHCNSYKINTTQKERKQLFKVDSFYDKVNRSIIRFYTDQIPKYKIKQNIQIVCEVHEIAKLNENVNTNLFKTICSLFRLEEFTEELLYKTQFVEKCISNKQINSLDKILKFNYPQLLNDNIHNKIVGFLCERKLAIDAYKRSVNVENGLIVEKCEYRGRCNKSTYKKFFFKSM